MTPDDLRGLPAYAAVEFLVAVAQHLERRDPHLYRLLLATADGLEALAESPVASQPEPWSAALHENAIRWTVRAFAAHDFRRGKQKTPGPWLVRAAQTRATESDLRAANADGPEALKGLWHGRLAQTAPLTPALIRQIRRRPRQVAVHLGASAAGLSVETFRTYIGRAWRAFETWERKNETPSPD